jgi:hypothetical protein
MDMRDHGLGEGGLLELITVLSAVRVSPVAMSFGPTIGADVAGVGGSSISSRSHRAEEHDAGSMRSFLRVRGL